MIAKTLPKELASDPWYSYFYNFASAYNTKRAGVSLQTANFLGFQLTPAGLEQLKLERKAKATKSSQ